jgi:hypothetical protein
MGLELLLLGLAAAPSPVLVELFSSEGCSSCPSAEVLLRERAIEDPGLLVLEFHVDYWNGLGWKDGFSSPAFTDRQSHYAAVRGTGQVFTPEAIVDGRTSIVGSDASALAAAVARARRSPPAILTLRVEGDAPAQGLAPPETRLEIGGEGVPAGRLWVAVTESGLQTMPARGENRGRRLLHAPVVRRFEEQGPVSASALHAKIAIPRDPAWERGAIRIVAAVQDPENGRILALGSTAL